MGILGNKQGLTGQAVSQLYESHADELLTYFARRTFDGQVAFDLVAETFATAFEQRASCRARGKHDQRAWLYGIGRNLLSDFYRDGHIERRALAKIAVDPPQLSEQSFERIEELADLHRARVVMATALNGLSEDHREALVLRVIEERPYPEVAAALQVSEQTARARVSRALRGLRDAIETTSEEEAVDHA